MLYPSVTMDIGPLVRQLEALDGEVQLRVLKRAAGAGTSVLLAAVRRRAPKRSGVLSRAVVMVYRPPRAGDRGEAFRVVLSRKVRALEVRSMRVSSIELTGEVRTIVTPKGKRRRVRIRRKVYDPSGARKLGFKKHWPYVYARFLEFGTRRRAAHPFVAPAAQAEARTAMAAVETVLAFEIAKAAQRTRGGA